jgi:REP element-mobilizing transposase RayT
MAARKIKAVRGRAKAKPTQGALPFRTWGGARPGAGRPRTSQRVSHLTRVRVTRHLPLHVTLRFVRGLPNLRGKAAFRVVRETLAAPRRGGVRVNQYSVQSNHVHLIVEASSTQGLTQGMQALSIRLAKALNRLFERSGRIFEDRFHVRALGTPLEVRRALAYVLNNFRRHADAKGPRLPLTFRDPMSSAHWFDGWDPEFVCEPPDKRALVDPLRGADPGVVPARSFLLKSGWRRYGFLPIVAGST